jgi:hypothetical protein
LFETKIACAAFVSVLRFAEPSIIFACSKKSKNQAIHRKLRKNLPMYIDRFFLGRTADTAIEPIVESLYNLLLNYKLLKTKLTNLNQLTADLIKSDRATATQFLL